MVGGEVVKSSKFAFEIQFFCFNPLCGLGMLLVFLEYYRIFCVTIDRYGYVVWIEDEEKCTLIVIVIITTTRLGLFAGGTVGVDPPPYKPTLWVPPLRCCLQAMAFGSQPSKRSSTERDSQTGYSIAHLKAYAAKEMVILLVFTYQKK